MTNNNIIFIIINVIVVAVIVVDYTVVAFVVIRSSKFEGIERWKKLWKKQKKSDRMVGKNVKDLNSRTVSYSIIR